MKYGFLVLLFCYAPGLIAKNQTYAVDAKASKVEFNASGNPGFIRINGTEGHADGKLTYDLVAKKLSGLITVVVSDFTTGMSLRDRHMKEKYLEVEKFPKAELTLESVTLDLSKAEIKEAIPAKLKMHGVEKPITIQANISKASSDKPHVVAEFKVVLSDFNIDIPSFAGVTVAKDVAVNVELDAEKVAQ